MKPDILNFFRYRGPFNLNYRITYRLIAIMTFLGGGFSFADMVSFISPGGMSPDKKAIWQKLVAKYINPDGSVMLFGKPFFVPYQNYGDFIFFVQQVIIDDQYHVKKFLGANSAVIDGGANMGVFSVFVANKYPDSTIYAFEPTPYTFDLLKKNIEPYSNVQAFQIGLGEEAAQRDFQVYLDSSGINHFNSENFQGQGSETISVKLTTIDNFVNENSAIKQINFIKLDTEGYEPNILKGAIESIKKWAPVIAMSAYHRPSDKVELPKILQSANQNYYCEVHNDNEEDFICYVK